MVQLLRWLLLVLAPLYIGAKPPHIIFIVADDLGWNDVGFNNPDMITPNIDALAHGGIILNQSYVQPVCSPSRSAFMTGYYPFRTGLQHVVIEWQQATCAPTHLTFLPQELKKLGYKTHAVGKWHLGFCNWNCTPTYRGFDTFYGFYNGAEDYYHYDTNGGYDFRSNTDVMTKQNGTYSTFAYQEHLRQLVTAHDPATPFFLYLPFQSVHTPLQAPKQYTDMYPNLKTEGRRIFSGQVTAMDDVIGNLTSFLQQRGMYSDTLFIFTADNGGFVPDYGNNFPLRGCKGTVWEGGTRAAAFLHGYGLPATGLRYDGMMHAVDWYPTLVEAAGGQVNNKDMDGVSMWKAITTLGPSPRTEFVYNIDNTKIPVEGHAAIRHGDYKLVQGYPGLLSGWYPPDQEHKLELNLNSLSNEDETAINRLYNLKDDPLEYKDLALQMPELVQKLKDRLNEYMKLYVEPNYPPPDPKSDPKNYGGVWSPGWC